MKLRRPAAFMRELAGILKPLSTRSAAAILVTLERRTAIALDLPESFPERIVGRAKRCWRIIRVPGHTVYYRIDKAADEIVLEHIFHNRRDHRQLL